MVFKSLYLKTSLCKGHLHKRCPRNISKCHMAILRVRSFPACERSLRAQSLKKVSKKSSDPQSPKVSKKSKTVFFSRLFGFSEDVFKTFFRHLGSGPGDSSSQAGEILTLRIDRPPNRMGNLVRIWLLKGIRSTLKKILCGHL